MAPIDYSRFDDIDTSSSDGDEDGDETELEAGDAPSIDQLLDSFHQIFPGHRLQPEEMRELGLLTETQARAMYRAMDPLNNEDARPRRRRVAYISRKDDPNDAFFPPIFTERKKKLNSRATEKKKTRRTKEPCASCGTRTRKRCGGCHKLGIHTPYCGASCQNAHWPTHRRACGERHPAIVARKTSPTSDALDESFGSDATAGTQGASCNRACAARDAHALAEALRAGLDAPDADTCEIAAAWNALECLKLLHAHGCEMNEAACLVTAVRYGARDCVLWLRDVALFGPKNGMGPKSAVTDPLAHVARVKAFVAELVEVVIPHCAVATRTAFERANRIERDFEDVKGFMSSVVRDAMRCGLPDEPAHFRDPCDPFSETDFEADAHAMDPTRTSICEDGPDEDVAEMRGYPRMVRFPAGAIDAPPGYEVVEAWGMYG